MLRRRLESAASRNLGRRKQLVHRHDALVVPLPYRETNKAPIVRWCVSRGAPSSKRTSNAPPSWHAITHLPRAWHRLRFVAAAAAAPYPGSHWYMAGFDRVAPRLRASTLPNEIQGDTVLATAVVVR